MQTIQELSRKPIKRSNSTKPEQNIEMVRLGTMLRIAEALERLQQNETTTTSSVSQRTIKQLVREQKRLINIIRCYESEVKRLTKIIYSYEVNQ